jgi:hypothetical protein
LTLNVRLAALLVGMSLPLLPARAGAQDASPPRSSGEGSGAVEVLPAAARPVGPAPVSVRGLITPRPAIAPVVDLPPLPEETASERFGWFGEQLIYAVTILGSTSARAGLSIGYPSQVEGHGSVIPLQGIVASVGLLRSLYPIHNTALTYLDPTTGLPTWSDKVLEERDVQRQYTVTYEGNAFRASIRQVRDGETRQLRRVVPSNIHDAFSWFLDLRSRDLTEGQRYEYFVFDGWKLSRLRVEVEQETQVLTGIGYLRAAQVSLYREVVTSDEPLPWADQAVRLPPVYLPVEPGRRVGRAWFGLDASRIPIGIELTTSIGPVSVMLQRYEPPTGVTVD